MTYPRHTSDEPVAPSRAFPRSRSDVLAFWKTDDTFQASIDQREGAGSGSSTTARRSPTACRTTATCSPATPRTSSRASRPCAASRCTAASAGTPTGCPPSSRRCASSASPRRARSRRWASRPSTRRRRESVLDVHARSGRSTSPARRAGSTSRTTTRRSTSTFMESVIWAFKQLHDKGLAYEGYRVLPYCWRDQTPLSQPRAAHGRRRLQDASGPVGHGHLPARRREGRGARAHRRARARLDDDAVDAARRTSRSPSGPGIEYAVVPAVRWALRAASGSHDARRGRGAVPARRPTRSRPTRRISATSRRDDAQRRRHPHASSAPTSRACTTTGCGTTTPTPRSGARRTRGASSSPTTSRPATAPASCTRRPPTVRTTRWRAPPPASPSILSSTTAGKFLPARRPTSPGCRCSTRTSRSPSMLRADGPPAAPGELRALATRTAGAAATR